MIVTGVVALSCSGCIIFPFPHYASPKSDSLRQNVSQELGSFPAPRENTREEVLLRLGVPDKVTVDGGRFHYHWNRIVFVWGVGGQYGGWGGSVFKNYELLIDFDAEGKVVDRSQVTLRTWSQTQRW